MPHRALQVVNKAIDLLTANGTWGSRVYKGRVTSLAEDEQETDGVLVYALDDSPTSANGNDSYSLIDSAQALSVISVAVASDEATLLDALMESRRQVHIALQADITLGLSFVTNVRYAGAQIPTIDDSGARFVGRLESRWIVLYRMNQTDPA